MLASGLAIALDLDEGGSPPDTDKAEVKKPTAGDTVKLTGLAAL